MPVQEEILPFRDKKGDTIAVARLVSDGHGIPFIRLSATEAAASGEEQLQLIEGRSYQYEIDRPDVRIEETGGVVKRFLIGASDLDRGVISTGLNTGLLRLVALSVDGISGDAFVEVRSSKLSYREEYRSMLERIAEATVDLLVHAPSISDLRLETDESASGESLQQQFFLLRGILEGDEFNSAIEQVLRHPHSRLVSVDNERHLSSGIRGSAAVSRQFSGSGRRQSLPPNHPLHRKLRDLGVQIPSVPLQIIGEEFEETRDTPENRFIKHAVSEFRDALDRIAEKLKKNGRPSHIMAEREVVPLLSRLDAILSNELFSEVSPAVVIPVSSTVLQRKAGYREILRTWLRFNATARLVWSGGEDVFRAGKRDVATLYEYWLFFVIWDVISTWIGADSTEILRGSLLEPTSSGLGLKLQTGSYLPVTGMKIVHNGKLLRMQFGYNKTFDASPVQNVSRRLDYQTNFPSPGSWTRRMRPDFTLAFWPADVSMSDAESEGSIIHLHFDAKYSVEFIDQLFGPGEVDLYEEKRSQRAGTYRRADLLKMHAYKDAIRRTKGAYILYPGGDTASSGDVVWNQYHEVLPGLGAFVIKPMHEAAGKASLHAFISDVLDQITQ